MGKKQQPNKVSDLEKVATEIANASVKSTLLLLCSTLTTALETQVKIDNEGTARELTAREVLIVVANTIGEYIKNMEKAENKESN